ncbi:hypothetical protein LCGC14_1637310 [marine sediment metagenome]|uniref:Uncharacterized protein n=1 Tax=marine sediment metagenome TaxID=412755 RepID=A0A0F9KGG8_9ZZZZ
MFNWKDTVMTDKAIMSILNRLRPGGIYHVRSLSRDFKRDVIPLLETQAEISFKAGKEERGKEEDRVIARKDVQETKKQIAADLESLIAAYQIHSSPAIRAIKFKEIEGYLENLAEGK